MIRGMKPFFLSCLLLSWRVLRIPGLIILALLNVGWSGEVTSRVVWTSAVFMPPDLETELRENHRRFDAGIQKGLEAPLSWRQGPPGHLEEALLQTALSCRNDLRKPVPLGDLVEELGILSVLVLQANDPLAVDSSDPREARYAQSYRRYVFSILGRVRLVYYGWDGRLNSGTGGLSSVVSTALDRSRRLYPFVGQEFYRGGALGSWKDFDDRSIAFGVAAVSLSRGMTDFINLCRWIWKGGGGMVPEPRPTPLGHRGPVIVPAPKLKKGFEKLKKEQRGAPAMPRGGLSLPPP